ncbi:hypothetical protein ACFWHT_13945 [Microbacterium sp. NPDC058342]|uniref:hypothetical protein n=1 Tax=Microbacterium sp. NPDC058342 TaxID=3346454 RepID=UPI00365C2F65
MTRRTRSLAPIIGLLAAAALLIAGCTPVQVGEPASDRSPAAETLAPPSTSPSSSPTPDGDATTSFLAWLDASRIPDIGAACAPLAPALVDRMLAEMRSDGFPDVSTCDEMITLSAELYRAFDQSAEVEIDVQSETASDAILFVTYLANGDCGTVVMERPAATWIITEQTEGCD